MNEKIEARLKRIEATLGTSIAWQVREFGEHGVTQLLDMLHGGPLAEPPSQQDKTDSFEKNCEVMKDTPFWYFACSPPQEYKAGKVFQRYEIAHMNFCPYCGKPISKINEDGTAKRPEVSDE